MACKRRRWRGPKPAAFFMRVPCRQSWRSTKPPAARLRPSVGPLATHNAVAGETGQKERPGARHHRKPGIFRAYSGHNQALSRAVSFVACRIVCRWSRRPGWPVAARRVRRRIACGMARRVRYRLWSVTASRMVVACGIARCRIACGMTRRRIASRHVPRPTRRPRCPSRVHGRVSRRPVMCHVPAPQRREPTPPAAVYEHVFFSMTVAFNECAFGGAAKANRWAVASTRRVRGGPLRSRTFRTFRAFRATGHSGQPGIPGSVCRKKNDISIVQRPSH